MITTTISKPIIRQATPRVCMYACALLYLFAERPIGHPTYTRQTLVDLSLYTILYNIYLYMPVCVCVVAWPAFQRVIYDFDME